MGVSRPCTKKSTGTARYFSSIGGDGGLCAISDIGVQEYLDLNKLYIELCLV